MDESCPNPRKFSYQTLACATNNFSEKDKLGEGATGSVFKGFLRELSCSVAVKRIAFGSKYGMESYLPEVKFQENGMKFELKLVDWVCEKIERGENVSAVADPRLGLSYDEKEMEQLIFVGLSCVNPNPYDRPSIWELIKMLKC
uniref:L-type lectin-domain containing receptor kinase IX.1-like n=1 Tax=Populus alba TaxID=43335 RepID=A0A4U5PMW9_POPAL|nr:L-type lectin-domain containing receptor kinase IX.1-like [Populus alba]